LICAQFWFNFCGWWDFPAHPLSDIASVRTETRPSAVVLLDSLIVLAWKNISDLSCTLVTFVILIVFPPSCCNYAETGLGSGHLPGARSGSTSPTKILV